MEESVVTTPDNQLLAGYLAHEFLTRGTLFGNRFRTAGGDETRPAKRPRLESREKHAPAKENADGEKHRVYVEVARLLREEGLHLPGIVNPLQLAVYLQIV